MFFRTIKGNQNNDFPFSVNCCDHNIEFVGDKASWSNLCLKNSNLVPTLVIFAKNVNSKVFLIKKSIYFPG